MTQIWKFKIDAVREQIINMPHGAEILTVQMQNNTPYIWAIVNPLFEKSNRKILIFGTGHEMKESQMKYIGTFQIDAFQPSGILVFHVFEER